MSDLVLFLRAEAWEHKDGIKKMGFRGKVTELNLWKAADRIEELEARLELATELIDALDEHEGGKWWLSYMNPMLEAWYATCSIHTPEDK